jgi:hypothetical protein
MFRGRQERLSSGQCGYDGDELLALFPRTITGACLDDLGR